ncbi:MAG: sporulation integral membrane protein YtvI [Lachnospiraceae bacterium]
MSTSMKKYVKAILNLVIALVALILIIWLLPKGIIFFLPFIIGWIIAWIAGPMVRFFEEKLKIRRKAGSVFVIVVVIGLVILVCYLVGGKLIRELVSFIQDLPNMWASLEEDFNEIAKNLSVVYDRLPKDVQNTLNNLGEQANNLVADILSKISSPTIAAVGNFAKQLPTIIIGIIMCLLSSYFFVAEREQLAVSAKKYIPETLFYKIRLIKNSMVKAVGGYLKAQIKIEIWIYLLLVIGFVVLGVDYALLIAFGIAILDFLPFFGTGTAMVPWAIVKFLSADYKMTIGLLLTWGISQLVRQIIQPKIVGDSIGMPPIPTLFLLYIGYMVGGVVGMIVAVPIGIIFWTMYEEGVFDTTKNSIQILAAGLNHFRKLTPQDMYIVDTYKQECEAEFEERQEREEKKEREKSGNGNA